MYPALGFEMIKLEPFSINFNVLLEIYRISVSKYINTMLSLFYLHRIDFKILFISEVDTHTTVREVKF